MRLHENRQLFADAINAASRPKSEGGLGIKSIFIEKDYWICRSLKLMAVPANSTATLYLPASVEGEREVHLEAGHHRLRFSIRR